MIPRRSPWSLPFEVLIRLYQVVLGPFLGGQCRYEPTCSHYGLAAYREHGVIRGTWLTLCRLARCHPFVKGGYDPVPLRSAHVSHATSAPHLPPRATNEGILLHDSPEPP